MNAHSPPAAAPTSTTVAADNAATDGLPTYAELAADPEIAALLDFDPVPRQVVRPNGWNPDRQREFIARLAHLGSPKLAAGAMNKNVSGVTDLYKQRGTESFRAAWDAALALGLSRRPPDTGAVFLGQIPGMSARHPENRLPAPATADYTDHDSPPAPGQVRNEHGEWEDAESYRRRGAEACDSISQKLQRCRRLYLQEICASPAHRAAFEILTELPIDWAKAARLEPQDDEPWRTPNMRTPEMLLTAENGWMGGIVHGPDKKVALLKTLNAYRVEHGLPEIGVDAEEDE